MIMDKPELYLTIAIPTYNRSKQLREALDFFTDIILNEGNNKCEIFVSDNCSTDDTKQLLEEYSKKNNFIRYDINEDNIGPCKNILLAAANAKGKYIWFFGDDDLPAEGSIKNVLNIIEQYNPVYIFLNYGAYDKDVKIKLSNSNIKIYKDKWHLSSDKALKIIGLDTFFLSTNVVKREYYNNLKDLEKYADTEIVHAFFVISLMKMGNIYISVYENIKKRAGDVPIGVSSFVKSVRQYVDFMKNLGYSNKYTDIIANKFLFDCFIAGLKTGANGGDKEKYHGLVYDNFKDYLLFWILLVPLQIIPNSLLKICKIFKDKVVHKKK